MLTPEQLRYRRRKRQKDEQERIRLEEFKNALDKGDIAKEIPYFIAIFVMVVFFAYVACCN